MSTILLSPEELEALTDRCQPKLQIRWLIQHGWTFEVGDSGRPKVSRAYYETRMSGGKTATTREPNWNRI